MPHLIGSRFAPKLLTLLKDGYGLQELRRDALAGLTVAIVALPLSMAIAIASGAPPERGLYAAIIGGFLISALGGSRHQIGGPAGAFIVIVAGIIESHGFDGLILATTMAGGIMVVMGLLRLGSLIRFIPPPVILGFTAGIAVIILVSQIHDLFGLTLAVKEPAALLPKFEVLMHAWGSLNPYACLIAGGSILFIAVMRRARPAFPGLLVAVIVAAALTKLLDLPVETIGSRFGAIPAGLPAPSLPAFSVEKMRAVLPDALIIALLGSIESLLSAVVADGMTGRRHRSNTELVAQGIANIGSALFGGLCATGTIARTATNVQANAYGPASGLFHALYLLLFMLLAAPLMGMIPLAVLAGILTLVAWNMAEKHAILDLVRADRAGGMVFFVTFLLTITRNLMEGILAGLVLSGIILLIKRIEARRM